MITSYPKDELSEVAAVVAAIEATRHRTGPGSSRFDLLIDAVDRWEAKIGAVAGGRHQRSKRLRTNSGEAPVIDHPVPQRWFLHLLCGLPGRDLRIPYIQRLLYEHAGFALITADEERRLAEHGLSDEMPDGWDGLDRYARYDQCRISLGEDGPIDRSILDSLLRNPPLPYYVYILADTRGRIFYVGKGTGDRILSHERELFKRSYPVHTNWKKLNRIARIVSAGHSVVYEIDSWHSSEISALIRENALIIKYERADSCGLCNSNGRRWRGKPGKALKNLWKRAGL